jgi:diguanylate cyclase (GGDEF)-like protein/PAS domain S-box-containing protein
MTSVIKNVPPQGRVLVVDDDAIIRRLSRITLEETGYAVTVCPDGAAALELFSKIRPDVLLLDVILPGKDGFDVCEEIRALPEGKDVSIVMMTGLDDIGSIHKAYGAGATDFITKPINWQILAYRVHYIFRASQAFKDLRTSETRLSYAQQLARMGSWEWNTIQDMVQLSEACHHILGVTAFNPVRDIATFLSLIHISDRQHLRKGLDSLMESGHPFSLDCRTSSESGNERFIHLGADAHRDAAGHVVRISGTVQDINERKQAEEQIRYLAYYDSLTELPNRILFKEHLKRALAIAEQHGRLVAVLFIDMDRFKGINDSLGHDIGDLLLKQLAVRLQQQVRRYDTISRETADQNDSLISRLGGDEFTILLEGIADPEVAARVARRVLSDLETPFNLNGNEVFISCSIGISIYPDDGTDVDTLIKNADVAMYSAKELGRSTFQFYTQEMNAASFQRLVMETHLRKAFEKGEFSIHYQPQVDCTTNRIVGLEALVRWDNPEIGKVSPEIFISITEETGLVIPLDRWVLSTVCRHMDEWKNQGIPPVRVSVNLSAKHFIKNNMDETISQICQRTGASLLNLDLEITEGVLMENTEEVIKSLLLLKEMGIGISIDDFGTGYSSLSYLTRIPCRTLKIDKSFVSKIGENAESSSVVNAIIALARTLGKEVVAEGVETAVQLNFLKNNGCSVVQGYLYSPPVPEQEIRQLLMAGSIQIQPARIDELSRKHA